MIIQYIQWTMAMILQKILIALCEDIVEGIVRFGCGLEGIPYENI
jgi:hypothetical protein